MKSIKPGRGPSAMGAAGSIFIAIFGVFWTIMASGMGAPVIFTLFGIMFVVLAIVQGIYNFKNATGRNRMSVYDITDESEESDPLQMRIDSRDGADTGKDIKASSFKFCPFCGSGLDGDFVFCPGCGKKIRE